MKKLLSYLWPQTTKFPSDYSGELEVTFYNGKKMLDTKNANYSFGSLQQILETGLKKIDFTTINSVLVLGLGGGSVVHSLREKFNYSQLIHAVELDKKIIQLAKKEFGISSFENLVIEHANALDFVTTCSKLFDVVIVDIFIDDKVPVAFYQLSFCEHLVALMASKSALIFNLGMGDSNKKERNSIVDYFKRREDCTVNILEKVAATNTLLVVHKAIP